MFGIARPPDEGRREPTLAGAPRLVRPDPSRLDASERLAPVADRERARWGGPIGSLVLHLLPLLLLIEWPIEAPPEDTPIAVQLVLEPPPPEPPPQPVPPKPEFKPPPPGRIASEDLGDTEAKEASRESGNPPPAKDAPASPPPDKTETPPPEEAAAPPPETPQQTAAIVPPPPPEKPEPPKAKPKAAMPPVLRWEEESPHATTRPAKYPGPAATRDEYLAYVHSLIRRHYNLLPLTMVGGRRGEAQIEFIVLDDGTIAMIKVRHSSGWPDIDERVEMMIAAVGHVPPLPQWFQGPSMALILNLPFPEALRE